MQAETWADQPDARMIKRQESMTSDLTDSVALRAPGASDTALVVQVGDTALCPNTIILKGQSWERHCILHQSLAAAR